MGGLVDAFVNVVPYVSLVLLVVVGGALVYFAYFQQDSTSGPAVFGANSDMQDSLVEPTPQTQGGYTRHYRWLQTENEVELRVPVPEGATGPRWGRGTAWRR